MYFTSGSDRAFEQLMQGKPGFDHYDSGEAVTPEDCGTCRFYRPHWKYQFCVYAECPYQPGKLTAYDAVTFRVKGVENMAVFRVERNKGYTVMSNHHLRNKDLSLKAKGLLSQMLSLPEDWDYTLKGLSLINREQIDAIRAAIRELEQAGYIVRSRERDSQGRLRGADYVIYEQPQPVPDSPTLENPMLDKQLYLLTLPQIGGEKMNEYTFDYVERNRLDAFCKTVLRNEAINYLSELARRRDREKPLDTLPQAEMDKLCTLDEYPSDSFVFSAFGYDLHIRDELVAGAFATLPEQEQQILILHCVAAMADGEIGGLVGMSRSAAQRHRTKTLNELRQRLEDNGGRNTK